MAETRDPPPSDSSQIYASFLAQLASATRLSPQSREALLETLAIDKAQLDRLLKRALAEGRVKKLRNPVRYRTAPSEQGSLDL